ncbi:protein phosphatase 1 regulatory subunit 36 [Amia ocellicauda]|uniref:protein phosphatase 1 regulatory subunit 36 n=1 Tax=Amia ocellicauda TaxID=2972642 RepID=UPI00346404E3
MAETNEPISLPVNGRWHWNDKNQTLEFVSFNSTIETKDKRKKIKSIHFQEHVNKCAERFLVSSPVSLRGPGAVCTPVDKKYNGRVQLRISKPSLKHGQHEHVTIEDIKNVALNLLQENEAQSIPLCFMAVMRSQQLNDFLSALLLYLSCYFEKQALEKKPKPLMAEPSITERRNMAEACAKVELARKKLAFMYSVLVLGLGLSQQHHMDCGRSRVSATYKDRQLFECLYSFSAYAAWVTFKRSDLQGIQEEVGRLLRSDTFNPASRVKEHDEEQAGKDTYLIEGTASALVKRKLKSRRPAIKSIINQRSPVIISLLPSPKEKAQHLFKSSRQEQDIDTDLCDTEALMEQLMETFSSNVGIIGQPLSQFSRHTLVPLGSEQEDEEEDGCDQHIRSSVASFRSRGPLSSEAGRHGGSSQVSAVISRATTVGIYSDT